MECITAYNDLKLSKKYKYIIYKLSDDNKEIVVEEASADKDWENFREKLINATSKTKSVCNPSLPLVMKLEANVNFASGCCWQGPPLRRLRLRVQPCLWRG
ncbi:hypothetical protein KNSL1_000319 [Colletotrichum chrysophilum]|nr:hypothetical protein KNSL1_000319 [Colletotrichum chrysophilum]